MTKKEKTDEDRIADSIFSDYSFGSLIVDITSMANINNPTFTWTTNTNTDTKADYTFSKSDLSAITTSTVCSTINFEDPYAELEEFREEKEKEEEMRKEYPVLQEAYEEYQLIKKLVEDSEFDKTFKKRYEGFSKK